MFWFLFFVFIMIFGIIGFVADFFEQMKESEYEFVRIIYWGFVVIFWVMVVVWISNW